MEELESKFSQKPDYFASKVSDAKNLLTPIIRSLIRETNKNKLSYEQLIYIFRRVREKCDIEVPQKPKRLIELPTTEELDRFYYSIKRRDHKLIFQFLEGTGLRVSEFVNLKVSRIDFEANRVFISQGKGQKDRITLIGNKLKEKTLLYLDGRNLTYLFESNRHTKYSTRRIEQLCVKYKQKSKIEKELTPHTFRHIFITNLATAGVSEEKRALLVGHSENSDIQKVYTHLSLGNIRDEVIDILDRL